MIETHNKELLYLADGDILRKKELERSRILDYFELIKYRMDGSAKSNNSV